MQLFHPKGLAGLFEKIGTEDVEYFCQQQLKELAYPTEPTLQELRKTLKVFRFQLQKLLKRPTLFTFTETPLNIA